MKKVLVLYDKQDTKREQTLVEGKKQMVNNTYIKELEVELEVEGVPEKDSKRMPHSVAKNKAIELWKFFISLVDGKVVQLTTPRYMLRIGNEWVKIKEIIEL